MIVKYNSIGQKKIVLCILNNLKDCKNSMAKDISINTIDFMIRGAIGNQFDILISDNETDLLVESANNNLYTHAVIVTTGTYLWSSDKLFNKIEKCCNQDFFIAGHILDRKEGYLELHKQFYIINLNDYKNLGYPAIEEGEWFVDNFHDEYIPIISEYKYRADKVIENIELGAERKTYKFKLHGWNILKLALEHHKKIIDVGDDIRMSKRYLYHEHDHVFINEYSKIFHQQLFARNVVAPWNSDKVHDQISFNGPVEQYITLGTGLNWIRNLIIVGYTTNTKIVFTDINHNCLTFMKELVETWDGNDYNKFYHSFKQFLPSGVPEHVLKNLSVDNDFNKFKDFFDDWIETWNEVRKLTFDYKLIDYTAEYDLSWIDPDKKTLINFSDLFNYTSLIPFQSVKFRIATENRLIDKLIKINPNIVAIFTSRAASGYKSFIDVPSTDSNSYAHIGKIVDFEFTDIEDLKMLPWHVDDWKSTGHRPLGV